MKILPVNDQIRSHSVILIGSDGSKKGQFLRTAALVQARTEGLDLIQVSESTPPVCKIADFGKLQFDRSKAEKKNAKQPEQKEMWFHLGTQQHDIDIKTRKVLDWLAKHHKVRFVIKLDGRERYSETHRDMASSMLKKFAEENKSVCTIGPISSSLKDVSVVFVPAN